MERRLVFPSLGDEVSATPRTDQTMQLKRRMLYIVRAIIYLPIPQMDGRIGPSTCSLADFIQSEEGADGFCCLNPRICRCQHGAGGETKAIKSSKHRNCCM